MPHPLRPSLVLPLIVFAACAKDQPTAPTSSAEIDGPSLSHTAEHKVVNSVADPGDGICNARQCTLREAINHPASTQITFAPGLTGPITLVRTLGIDKALSITGPSAGMVIRRRTTDPAFRIFRIGHATVTMRNLIIRNGKADRQGGGIISYGTLRLIHGTVSANSPDGIDNHGALTVTNSDIVSNLGGGIVNRDDVSLTVTNSTVAHNAGVGITNNGGMIVVTHSTVADNSGGGVAAVRGTSDLSDVRIVDNSSSRGGGIVVFAGRVRLTNSTVARNSAGSGGGIFSDQGSTFTITNSTIVGNTATNEGGGIANEAFHFCRVGNSLRLTNSTVSGNSASSGGGISNAGCGGASLRLTNSTVARNSATRAGGGIIEQTFEAGGTNLTNSLVAQNSAPKGPDVLKGGEFSSISARFSLIGDGTDSGISNTDGNQVGNVSPHDSPIDPRIGPLAQNGGPTRTHALQADSPALDAASTSDCPRTDQRGVLRPQGAGCDIGSYERE
jgi:CSLREA domain-containing protein